MLCLSQVRSIHVYLLCCAYGIACWPVGPPDARHADQHAQVDIIMSWLLLLCHQWISAGLYVIQLFMWQTDLLSRADAAPSWLSQTFAKLKPKFVLHLQTQLVHVQRGAWEARRCPAPDSSMC